MWDISLIDPLQFCCDVIVGKRPDAIKLASVLKALRQSTHLVRMTSGQHSEICHSALAAFGRATDYALNVKPVGRSPNALTGN
jgi:UDP-N-acetylglucosamine 2-epimerase